MNPASPRSEIHPRALVTDVAALRDEFAGASPFPHLVLLGLFRDDMLAEVLAEFPRPEDAVRWTRHEHPHSRKLACNDQRHFGPATRALIAELNGAAFVSFLAAVTRIEDLVADEQLVGGGLHQIERGGFLGIHADFNIHPISRLDRRLNVLLYLNRDWRDDYGGDLELWDRAMLRCERRISPAFNTLVVFATTDTSYHGHPAPLACPPGVTRRSIALYYYSRGRPATERSPEHSTLYRTAADPARAKG